MRTLCRFCITMITVCIAIVLGVMIPNTTNRQTTDALIDSRPCLHNPSAKTCNGVLPFMPHVSILKRTGGSGACFDDQRMLMEDQQITDVTDEHNTGIGTLQLWYFASCKSYAAHLIFNPDGPHATISTEVQQFDQGGIGNAITHFFWRIGDQDDPLPSATEQTGPIQDDELWSPLLYSLTAPVRASAVIDDTAHGALYGPLTGYYAAGKPVTINGKRY